MNDVTILVKPASSLCNMRCDYCFYNDVSEKRKVYSYGIMEDATLQAMIQRAFAFAKRSVSFVFQGGEPTLAGLDFFKKAVAYQQEYAKGGVAVYNSIQTNGINIDSRWASFFKENDFFVGVSLDGGALLHDKHRKLSSGEGSYERVMQGIKALKTHAVPFNILAVISADSAADPNGVYNALSRYGHLQFIPLIDVAESEKNGTQIGGAEYGRFLTEIFNYYYRDIFRGKYVSIRDFDCYVNTLQGMPPFSCSMKGLCGGYFTIEADGSVYPCDFYVTDEYRLGNIKTDSFFTLEKSEVGIEFIGSSAKLHEDCVACKWYFLCKGGCRRYRDPVSGLNKFCSGYKYFFENTYEKMLKIVGYVNEQNVKRAKR